MKRNIRYRLLAWLILAMLTACSTTSGLQEGEVLYRGIDKIKIDNEDKSQHGQRIVGEVLAAREAAPNGALLGSSKITTPFPIGLWVHNSFSRDTTGIGKWLNNSFGNEPVLISTVNPSLRTRMASVTLQNYGYFRSKVSHEIVPNPKNERKAKINIAVDYYVIVPILIIMWICSSHIRWIPLSTTTSMHLRGI